MGVKKIEYYYREKVNQQSWPERLLIEGIVYFIDGDKSILSIDELKLASNKLMEYYE